MQQTVLLIGGTGFVGMHLQRELLGKHRVFAYGRDVDVRDYSSLLEVIYTTRPSRVVHLASVTTLSESFEKPKETYDVIFGGTLNLLMALKECGFGGRLLFVSSSEVYGWPDSQDLPVDELQPLKPRNPYAVAKIAAEMLCYQWSQEHHFEVLVARPFNHIGPGQSDRFAIADFAKQVIEIREGQKEPILHIGDVDVTRDFTDVRDVVRAYAMLLEQGRNGETYNICSGKEVPVQTVIEHLIQLAGKPIQVQLDSTRVRKAGLPRICGNYMKIAEDVGWEPEIKLNDTLGDILTRCGETLK